LRGRGSRKRGRGEDLIDSLLLVPYLWPYQERGGKSEKGWKGGEGGGEVSILGAFFNCSFKEKEGGRGIKKEGQYYLSVTFKMINERKEEKI